MVRLYHLRQHAEAFARPACIGDTSRRNNLRFAD